MPKVIDVNFRGLQGTQELYISTGVPKKIYIRQSMQDNNHSVWMTANKAGNSYEASTPVKAGIIIRIVKGAKKEKNILFVETIEADAIDTTYSEKTMPMVCDYLKEEAKAFAAAMYLHDYGEWKEWLLNKRAQYRYCGNEENWLYFGSEITRVQQIDTIDVFGVSFPVIETEWKHMVYGESWKVVEIKDEYGAVVLLCGYKF